MCGKETELFITSVEGTDLKVCQNCAKFGKIKTRAKPLEPPKKKKQVEIEEEEPEIIQTISSDYALKVKNARESLKLKQEELAKKLNEKESVIHKIETGHYEPNIKLAKKLERFLKIKLVEEEEVNKEKQKASKSSGPLTIGDILKIKK